MFSKKYSPSRLVLFWLVMVLVFVVGGALTEAAIAACAVLVLGISCLNDTIEDSKRFPSLKFVWKSAWKTMKFAVGIIVFWGVVGLAWQKVTGSLETVELKNEAGKGNPDAQFNLGWCYTEGKGVEQSWTEAAAWYRKAAEQGNAGAQFRLGRCYARGLGVEQSWAEAVRWWCLAAQNVIGR